MNSIKKNATILEDVKINVKMKLSALWVAVMFCIVYANWFTLFVPGFLEQVTAGMIGTLGPTTQEKLLGVSIYLSIPSVMVFLSLTLKPKANRWANIILGVIFTVVVFLHTLIPGLWAYYIYFGVVEVVLTALIVWYAWNWPKQEVK